MPKKPTKSDKEKARKIGKKLSDVLTATFHTLAPSRYKRVSYSTKSDAEKIELRLALIGIPSARTKKATTLTVVTLTFRSQGGMILNSWDKSALNASMIRDKLLGRGKERGFKGYNLYLRDPEHTAAHVLGEVIDAITYAPSTFESYRK